VHGVLSGYVGAVGGFNMEGDELIEAADVAEGGDGSVKLLGGHDSTLVAGH